MTQAKEPPSKGKAGARRRFYKHTPHMSTSGPAPVKFVMPSWIKWAKSTNNTGGEENTGNGDGEEGNASTQDED